MFFVLNRLSFMSWRNKPHLHQQVFLDKFSLASFTWQCKWKNMTSFSLINVLLQKLAGKFLNKDTCQGKTCYICESNLRRFSRTLQHSMTPSCFCLQIWVVFCFHHVSIKGFRFWTLNKLFFSLLPSRFYRRFYLLLHFKNSMGVLHCTILKLNCRKLQNLCLHLKSGG